MENNEALIKNRDEKRVGNRGGRTSVYRICLLAMAVVINVVGAQIALTFRLPIYLDSVGTIMAGAFLGPVWGMLPNLLSGVILGMTSDIYSLYFAPAGMVTGLMAGMAWKMHLTEKRRIWLGTALVTLPGTLMSAVICGAVFGGITSSGSTVLVQLLARTPIGMTASIFLVQIVTDYLDRLISIFFVGTLLEALPYDLKCRWRGETGYGNSRKPLQQNHG